MLERNSLSGSPALRGLRCTLVSAVLAATLFPGLVHSQSSANPLPPPEVLGARIVRVAGEPELRVDGVPFFVHAAQFDYFRIPRDLWASSLDRYRELGINTIDLRIPWNWHEPEPGEFDFNGYTNPRRDLRGLLDLIVRKRLRLIARPGPIIDDQWRNGGLPDWLIGEVTSKALSAPSERASQDFEWAEQQPSSPNPSVARTSMDYARRWFHAVGHELAPYGSRRLVRILEPGSKGDLQERKVSGPLLFVALDDSQSLPGAERSTSRATYLGQLQAAMTRGGVDAIYFVTPRDLATRGAAPLSSTPAPGARTAMGISGRWNLKIDPIANFSQSAAATSASFSSRLDEFRNASLTNGEQAGRMFLTASDASVIAFEALTLATQPFAPPILSEFSPTAFISSSDAEVTQPAPQNLLVASRMWIGNGIRGIEYSPLQDTLTPAGWNAPGTSRHFRWDAPLDLNGNRGARAQGVFRNGLLSSAWGAMLGAAHVHADFGIIDLRTAAADDGESDAASRVAGPIAELFRAAQLAGFVPDLVNPGAQPIERLSRDAVLVLPVPPDSLGYPGLSETTQKSLVAFVRGGGTLIYFPARAKGALLEPLWQNVSESGSDARENQIAEWSYGQGHVISSSSDLLSPDGTGSPATAQALAALLAQADVVRSVERAIPASSSEDLIVTELVPDDPATTSTASRVCAEHQLCAASLISVTNLGDEPRTDESLSVIDPLATAVGRALARIPIEVSIPAHESLLLPLHAPLCSAGAAPAGPAGDKCTDEVISAGAELLNAEREDKTLELTFYAPTRAVVRLHLESAPSKVEIDPEIRLETKWNQESGVLEVPLLRGAAPDFLRVMRIHLHYTPHVYEKNDTDPNRRGGFEVGVEDSVRLPMGRDSWLPSFPPLILADPASGGQATIVSRNHVSGIGSMDFSLTGPFRGSGFSRSFSDGEEFTRVRFQPTAPASGNDLISDESEDGLLRGELDVRSGHDHKSGPVFFIPLGGSGVAHYRFDFERDGEDEWVLESPDLRLIVSAENGGRAVALVDKSTNEDLITLDGALDDRLVSDRTVSAQSISSQPASTPSAVDVPSFERPYSAEWISENDTTTLRATSDHPKDAVSEVRVEKTMRIAASDTLNVSYKVSMGHLDGNSSAAALPSFESIVRVPAESAADENTEFCWHEKLHPSDSGKSIPAAKNSDAHCEPFTPNGAEIRLPENVTRVETRTKNHSTLAAEWSAGRVIIIPSASSAQIRFVFPAATQPDKPIENTLRYTVVPEP